MSQTLAMDRENVIKQRESAEWDIHFREIIVRPFLQKIYSDYASVSVISGAWKTGKTDLGLKIMEWLKDLGLASMLASNVETSGEYDVRYINDMISLRSWGSTDKFHRKAYLYDEAIKSTPSRRAMQRINVEWLKFVPELSKCKMQLIVVTQETDYIETSFLHPRFIRAIWEKIRLPEKNPQFRKMVKLYSMEIDHIPVFVNLPRCKTQFDPLEPATFYAEPETDRLRVSMNVQLALDYGDGLSSTELVNKYEELTSRKEAMRRLRLGIRELKSSYLLQHIVGGNKETELGNKKNINNGE